MQGSQRIVVLSITVFGICGAVDTALAQEQVSHPHSAAATRSRSSRLSVTTGKREYFAEPFHYARSFRRYRYRATVITTFRNPLGKSVFLERCYSMDPRPIFELIPIVPEPSWSGSDWACVATKPIKVRPGKIKIDTLTIEGPNGFNRRSGEVLGRIQGRFKIGFMLRDCADVRCALIDSIRFSNAFEVRLAEGITSSTSSMAGCYALGWVPGIEQTTMITPPRRFRLYSSSASVGEARSVAMRVRPIIPLGDSSEAHWIQFGRDSIFVAWRSGLSGYRLRLRPDGGLLFGSLEVFSLDRVIRDNITDAVARRVVCDRTFRFL